MIRPIDALLFASAEMTVDPIYAANRDRPAKLLSLQSVSFDEASSAGATGTGCTWSGGKGSAHRLFMADDRAVVKLAGRTLKLRPTKGAVEVFPFTYHRWTGEGLRISVRDTTKIVKRGKNYVETVVWLNLYQDSKLQTRLGELKCDS